MNIKWIVIGTKLVNILLRQKEDGLILNKFSEMLTKLNFKHHILEEEKLKKLGTNFYKVAVYTEGGILLHPAKLVRAMVNALPNNVQLFKIPL